MAERIASLSLCSLGVSMMPGYVTLIFFRSKTFKNNDERRLGYSLLYFLLLFVLSIPFMKKETENEKKNIRISREKKIKSMRIGILLLLISSIIQQSLVFYLIHYPDESLKDLQNWIIIYIIFPLGLLTTLIFWHFIVGKASACFIPSQRYDIIFLIVFLILFGAFDLSGKIVIVSIYFPFHLIFIRSIYSLFMNPSEMMFINDSEEHNIIICKTWTGKEYKGRLRDFKYFFKMNLAGVEVDGKKTDVDLLQCNIKSIEICETGPDTSTVCNDALSDTLEHSGDEPETNLPSTETTPLKNVESPPKSYIQILRNV